MKSHRAIVGMLAMSMIGVGQISSAPAVEDDDDDWPSAKGKVKEPLPESRPAKKQRIADEAKMKSAEEKRARRRARNIAILARQKS